MILDYLTFFGTLSATITALVVFYLISQTSP
jgi:hypothetical protein